MIKRLFAMMLVAAVVVTIASVSHAAHHKKDKKDTSDLTVKTDKDSYGLDQMVHISITNNTSEHVMLSMQCNSTLQMRMEGARDWVDVITPDCSNVKVRPSHVGPGETLSADLPLEYDTLAYGGQLGEIEFRLIVTAQTDDGKTLTADSKPFALVMHQDHDENR